MVMTFPGENFRRMGTVLMMFQGPTAQVQDLLCCIGITSKCPDVQLKLFSPLNVLNGRSVVTLSPSTSSAYIGLRIQKDIQ